MIKKNVLFIEILIYSASSSFAPTQYREGTVVAQFGGEHLFANVVINNWIPEEFHVESNVEQMELSDTESNDLYDNGHEQNKSKVHDGIPF